LSRTPPIAAAPVIETARLRLRAHGAGDLEAAAAMWSDPDVVRFIGGKPFSGEETWARLIRYVGHWTLMGYGYWAIEERGSGRFAGEIGFADFRREIQTDLKDWPEAGWALAAWAQGQGYAGEAFEAALAWGDRHLPAPHTWCMIRPANAASIRLAESCGYREAERTSYKDQPTILFRR
jgi:RimJ/RimL family protein N-acetyltransferase